MEFIAIIRVLSFVSFLAAVMCECNNLPNCKCNTTSVTCDGRSAHQFGKEVLDAIKNLKDTVEYIQLTSYNITDLQQNFLGVCQGSTLDQYPRLKTLDLSRNQIASIHGKSFHCIPELQTLILSHNRWFVNGTTHVGVFTSLPSLRTLDLTNAFHDMINGTIHIINFPDFLNKNMTVLHTLKMGSNEFRVFPKKAGNVLCDLYSLRTLDLSNNMLMGNDIGLSSCMEQIKTIDLSHNMFVSLSKDMENTFESLHAIPSADPEIILDDNMWKCDCTMTDFKKWLNTTNVRIRNRHKLICYDGYPMANVHKYIIDLKESELKCPVPQSTAYLQPFYIVMGVIFALTACILAGVVYVKRVAIKESLLRCTKRDSPHYGYSYSSIRHV